ncbi:hypothetical protein B0H11DRAFT_1899428 [Mycena galericulata]|nr:hypothetical protein B0H11DRAFT_1899428 [Mycena galericulata]
MRGARYVMANPDGVQRTGYTLDDVFLTSRSDVKAQRAAGMHMLPGIARWVGAVHRGDTDLVPGTLRVADIPELKTRVLAAGIEALGERGSLGAHAIEVVLTASKTLSIAIPWGSGHSSIRDPNGSDTRYPTSNGSTLSSRPQKWPISTPLPPGITPPSAAIPLLPAYDLGPRKGPSAFPATRVSPPSRSFPPLI